MQKFILSFLSILLLIVPAFADEHKETAYERVIRTGTLRCGYISWPPFFEKDPKTDTFRGMNYDYVEAIAKSLDLTVEWVSEVPVSQSVEELRSGKIDAVCAAEGPLYPSTTKFLSYSRAFAYFPFFLYARDGDHRFDNNLSAINNKSIRIAVYDGDISLEISKTNFPDASLHSLTQNTSQTEQYMDVVTGKADLLVDTSAAASSFIKNNKGAVHKVKTSSPLAVIPNTFSVLRGPMGNDLLAMLNQAIENMQNRGQDIKIFAPYTQSMPDMLYPVAKPYNYGK